MRLFLTPVLAMHWVAIFAVLAFAPALETSWVGTPVDTVSLTTVTLSLCFSLAAALFLWMAISTLFCDDATGDRETTIRLAFTGGAIALTAFLIGSISDRLDSSLLSVSALTAALLLSYLVSAFERSVEPETVEAGNTGSARFMAVSAAENTTLVRFSDRFMQEMHK